MTPSARIAAAIEVLADIIERRRPASDALKDWGLARRFAGSKDRAAVASLVYDALRRKASAAWIMGEETPRAIVLGMLRLQLGYDATVIAGLCTGERHAPAPLTEAEGAALRNASLDDAPLHVRADVQEWLLPSLQKAFGDNLLPEMEAMARRAPVDIRVNTLKTTRDDVLAQLAPFSPVPTPHAPHGIRFAVGEDGRGPALQAERAFHDGWYEIQDEGSQLTVEMAGVEPGQRVVDLCAGAGGKTLALAAAMQGRGELHATDLDARRLSAIHARLARSGAQNVTVHVPRGKGDDPLAALDGTVDAVFVDAPCSGSGTWRRNPDAKWRIRPGSLDIRLREQAAVLARAARLVRPGGYVVYVTCSVLPEENDGAVAAFLQGGEGRGFRQASAMASSPSTCLKKDFGLQLSPARTGTDGFYFARLMRA